MTAVDLLEISETQRMRDLEKLVKQGLVRKGNDPNFNLDHISTGLPQLDSMLGGGLVRGRYVLAVGEYSSGKSFLTLRILKEAQAQGLIAAIVDTEHSFDRAWVERVGLDPDELLIAQTNDGEDVIDVVTQLLKSEVDVVVVDSLSGMIPRAEIEADASTEFRQLFPRLVSKAVRAWTAANTKTALILVNQIRAMENIPGGDAQGFFASAILRVKRAGWITDGRDETKGFNIKIVLKKSKQSTPWTKMTIPFHYDGLLDELGADIDFAIDSGIIRQGGAWYTYGEEKFFGKTKLTDFFKDESRHQELLTKLKGARLLQDDEDDSRESN